jgi:hypothetical protein
MRLPQGRTGRNDRKGMVAAGKKTARCVNHGYVADKSGVIPNEAAFQAERGISRGVPTDSPEIPSPK